MSLSNAFRHGHALFYSVIDCPVPVLLYVVHEAVKSPADREQYSGGILTCEVQPEYRTAQLLGLSSYYHLTCLTCISDSS